MENNQWIKLLDHIIEYFCIVLWITFVAHLGIKDLKKNGLRDIFKPGMKRKLMYISLVGLIGSVGLVHGIKHYVKRCRPNLIEIFGGAEKFSEPWIRNLSSTHEKCVSFVSGHSATGFLIFSLAFLYPASDSRRKKYILLGILVGASFGFIRIIQGEHFISDVIFSGYVVFFVAFILNYFLKPSSPRKSL